MYNFLSAPGRPAGAKPGQPSVAYHPPRNNSAPYPEQSNTIRPTVAAIRIVFFCRLASRHHGAYSISDCSSPAWPRTRERRPALGNGLSAAPSIVAPSSAVSALTAAGRERPGARGKWGWSRGPDRQPASDPRSGCSTTVRAASEGFLRGRVVRRGLLGWCLGSWRGQGTAPAYPRPAGRSGERRPGIPLEKRQHWRGGLLVSSAAAGLARGWGWSVLGRAG